MKHGQPIALLNLIVNAVQIVIPGPVFEQVLSNAQGAKARNAEMIEVAPEDLDADLLDALLKVPEVSKWVNHRFSFREWLQPWPLA